MANPYEILGVNETDTDEQIKKAYRDLVKKYHPDQYANNPLSTLAAEKIKEINVAYDEILRMRQNKSSNNYSYQKSDNSNNIEFDGIWVLIQRGDLQAAENKLYEFPTESRSAHWFFLMGEIARLKGWYDEARVNYTKAINMDPNNMTYRRALNGMYNTTYTYRKRSDRSGYNPSFDCCELCTYLWCADSCCECCGGDIISCC